jgi:hypothetical protein
LKNQILTLHETNPDTICRKLTEEKSFFARIEGNCLKKTVNISEWASLYAKKYFQIGQNLLKDWRLASQDSAMK